jgi:exopolysaccharide production protein ExoY
MDTGTLAFEFEVPDEAVGTSYYLLKRLLDVVGASILLLAITPLFVLIAMSIKLDSPGAVFFSQPRVGSRRRRKGAGAPWEPKTFRLYKFRSMTADADDARHVAHITAFVNGTLESGSVGRAAFKLPDDPRITRVGRVLRRVSLDEFPQLLNVIQGDMSLVGPRPLPPYEVALQSDRDRQRLAALPGMTGLWQVSGRAGVSYEQMIDLDLEYVRRQSLWLDLKILCLTVPAMVSGRGAA